MNKFGTLFKMQLKEKIDLSFLKSKKQTLFKVIFSILGFAVITALAYLVLWLCQFLNLFSALNHVPLSLMSFILFIIFVLNLITCTVGLSKTLYYAKDNQVLVTYPVNPNVLFLSKMLVYYINEIKKAFSFVIPIFVAYGLLCGFSIIYFIWCPVMLVIFTAIPVLLGGLLSIPMNYIMGFLKRYPIVKIILIFLALVALVTGVVLIISMIPENINLIKSWTYVAKAIRNFLSSFIKIFYPFYALVIFLCGKYENMTTTLFTEYSYIVLLVMLAVIVVLIGINLITSRPLYLRMITKQFEFNKNTELKNKKNKAHGKFLSTCLYEAKKNLRDTSVLSVSIATTLIAPIAILLLNTIYSAISTRLLGDYFTISFNILIIMLFVLAHNLNVSSVYSRDGEALYLNKIKPNSPFVVLFPRLFYNFAFTLLILIASCLVFFTYSTLSVIECILLFFAMLFIALTHMVWSAEIDFLNPKSNVFKTEGMAGINPNELKSMILMFLMAGLTFGITLFLLIDAMKYVWLKLFIISLALLALRLYLFYIKSKTLFKEM